MPGQVRVGRARHRVLCPQPAEHNDHDNDKCWRACWPLWRRAPSHLCYILYLLGRAGIWLNPWHTVRFQCAVPCGCCCPQIYGQHNQHDDSFTDVLFRVSLRYCTLHIDVVGDWGGVSVFISVVFRDAVLTYSFRLSATDLLRSRPTFALSLISTYKAHGNSPKAFSCFSSTPRSAGVSTTGAEGGTRRSRSSISGISTSFRKASITFIKDASSSQCWETSIWE